MAPCPQVFHGYSAPGGRENGSDVGSRGKRAVRCVAGRASRSPDTSSGTLGTWPDISRVGCVARREACAGGTCPSHARPRVSGPHGGRGPLIAGCRCPAGVKGWRGHSPGDRERLGPERVPGKIPRPAPVAPGASKGSCHGAWSCSPGPGFATGECLLRTPRKGGRLCLHGEGGWSSGGLRSQRSQSLLA